MDSLPEVAFDHKAHLRGDEQKSETELWIVCPQKERKKERKEKKEIPKTTKTDV